MLEAARLSQAAAAQEVSITPLTSYTVQEGDSLWAIAGNPRVYNNPYLWTRLYTANRTGLEDPEDPNLIEPGMVIEIPR